MNSEDASTGHPLHLFIVQDSFPPSTRAFTFRFFILVPAVFAFFKSSAENLLYTGSSILAFRCFES